MEEVKELFKAMTSQLKSKQQGDNEPCSTTNTKERRDFGLGEAF